ncbi:hypothetical protein ACHAPM_011638 [Fusarium culmorum]
MTDLGHGQGHGNDSAPYECLALLAIEDNAVTAGLDKHFLVQMPKLDIIRDNVNVSISVQSDMRKIATIIKILAPDSHGQVQHDAHGRPRGR